MIYNKPAHSIQQHIVLLQGRGLIINDIPLAEYYLSNISYYRLAGYWWSMQQDKINHTFKPQSTFENVIALYNFDKELRQLIFDVIERIEIALRTKLIYYLSHEVSPWWFEDPTIFRSHFHFQECLKSMDRELKHSKEPFIKEHFQKYSSDTRRPPAWKTLEVITYGTLSKLYGNLHSSVAAKNQIAQDWNVVNHTYLPSWLLTITQIRNICAHHGRLWNRNLPGRPKMMSSPPSDWIKDVPAHSDFKKLYIHVCCMKYLLDSIDKSNSLTDRLDTLFTKYPNIDLNALGFPSNWKNEPLFQ